MTTNLVKQIKEKINNGDKTFNKLISNVQHFITKINEKLELNSIDFIIKDKFCKNKSVPNESAKKNCLVN